MDLFSVIPRNVQSFIDSYKILVVFLACQNFQGLYVHYLPFEDDLRLYTFAPLIDNKRKIHLQPNEEQLEAVGSLVDKLTVHE